MLNIKNISLFMLSTCHCSFLSLGIYIQKEMNQRDDCKKWNFDAFIL